MRKASIYGDVVSVPGRPPKIPRRKGKRGESLEQAIVRPAPQRTSPPMSQTINSSLCTVSGNKSNDEWKTEDTVFWVFMGGGLLLGAIGIYLWAGWAGFVILGLSWKVINLVNGWEG